MSGTPHGTPRYAVRQKSGMPACRHYDPIILCDDVSFSHGRVHARELATAIGVAVNRDALTPIPHASLLLVDQALAGEVPGRAYATWSALLGACRRTPLEISPTALALLARTGLDLGTMLMLAAIHHAAMPGSVDANQLVSADGARQVWLDVLEMQDRPPTVRIMTATIGRGAHWSDGEIAVEGLPETVIAQLPGRPLSDLISHPDLDPLGLVITGTTPGDDYEIIHTDHVSRTVPVADLCVEAICSIEADAARSGTYSMLRL